MLDSANPFILVFVVLANLLIGGYVYRRNQNAPANRAFGLMAAMAAVWTVAVILSHHSSLNAASCARILLASGSMLPLATLFFVELATERFGSDAPNRARWFVLPTAVFFLLSFTSLIVREATRDNGALRITYGTLHPAYVAWALLVFAFAAKWLIFSYRRSAGQSRPQAAYLLLAFVIPIVVGASTNLLIPLLFKSSIAKILRMRSPVFSGARFRRTLVKPRRSLPT